MDKKNTAPANIQNGTSDNSNHRETSAVAQRYRLLTALKIAPVNTFEARERLNIMMPAARVKELRNTGHEVITERIQLMDSGGVMHYGVAKYILIRCASSDKEAA